MTVKPDYREPWKDDAEQAKPGPLPRGLSEREDTARRCAEIAENCSEVGEAAAFIRREFGLDDAT